jgi:hypothetical protein
VNKLPTFAEIKTINNRFDNYQLLQDAERERLALQFACDSLKEHITLMPLSKEVD